MHAHDLRRRLLWLPFAALLLVLASLLLPWPPQSEESPARLTPGSTQEQNLERQVERFALNVLLLALFDDSEDPPRWGDPVLDMACGEGTRVDVDAHRLDTGAPVPAGAFSVQWQLDDCLLFGTEGPALSGRASLDVLPEREALSAIVQLFDLEVQHADVTVVMNKAFVVRTP